MKLDSSNIENLCYKLSRDKTIFTKYSIFSFLTIKRNSEKKQHETRKIFKIIDGIIKNEISEIDRMVIELYYLKKPKRTQKQLASFLQVEQSYISKVIARINKRIKFYYYRRNITKEYLQKILYFLSEDYITTLYLYIYELNQEKVAKKIGKKQPTVSVRMSKISQIIRKEIASRSKDPKSRKNKQKLKDFYNFYIYMTDLNFYPSFCVKTKIKHIYTLEDGEKRRKKLKGKF